MSFNRVFKAYLVYLKYGDGSTSSSLNWSILSEAKYESSIKYFELLCVVNM